jgi:hypothetical protein
MSQQSPDPGFILIGLFQILVGLVLLFLGNRLRKPGSRGTVRTSLVPKLFQEFPILMQLVGGGSVAVGTYFILIGAGLGSS